MPIKLYTYLRLFGSRKWGGYTYSSDYDYLAKLDDYHTILHLLARYFHSADIVKTTAYGKYVSLKVASLYQIILLNEEDYIIQSAICDILDDYYKIQPSTSKHDRTCNYESLKSIITQGEHYSILHFSAKSFVEANYPELLL